MKILLIMASDQCYCSHGRLSRKKITNLEPVTLTTLAALVPKTLNAQIRIVDEGVQKGYYAGQLYDVVGIYCCTASAERAYSLSRYWKKKGAFVVMGGPHPSLNPQEASRYADSVVVGPGEQNWPRVLKDFTQGKTKKIYKPDYNAPCSSPIPRRDLIKQGYTPVPSVIANRGCIYPCKYCSIQSIWKKCNHKRPIPEVIEEIKSLKSKYIIILDPSPFSDKKYARELYEALMPLKIWWGGQATIDMAYDRQLLDLMVKSGCLALFVGFESFSQESMNKYNKCFNQVNTYKEVVQNLHEKGISCVGGFMLGADGDTKENLYKLPELVEEIQVDLPRYAILTPYPGTPLFTELDKQNRIIHKQWHLYDLEHVVFKPKNMTAEELQKIHHQTWQKSFRWSRMLKRIIRNKTMPKWFYFTLTLGFRYYMRKVLRLYNKPYDPDTYLHKL